MIEGSALCLSAAWGAFLYLAEFEFFLICLSLSELLELCFLADILALGSLIIADLAHTRNNA